MRLVDNMLEALEEEVEGAKEYAEKYIENHARGNMTRANRYKEMVADELKHANFLREMDIADIDELKKVYVMTEDEEMSWQHGLKHISEQIAMIKHMLSM